MIKSEKWTAVYGNWPGFTRRCNKCGRVWRPTDSKDDCTCAAESEALEFDSPPSARDDRGCGCPPCPFDLRSLGYPTFKEDPWFEGTSCGWHEEIVGTRGKLFVSGGTEELPIFAIDLGWTLHHFGKEDLFDNLKTIGAKR